MARKPTFSPAESQAVGQQIHRTQARAALKPWHIEYACWLAQQGRRPRRRERLEVASRLENKHRDRETQPDNLPPLTLTRLRWLEGREEFHALVEKAVQGGIEAAQAYIRSYYPMIAQAHVWAVEHAREKGDHRAMAQLTTPALDRFEPKKTEAPVFPAVINIRLEPQQLDAMSQPQATVEATALVQDTAGIWRWPDGRPVTELARPKEDE